MPQRMRRVSILLFFLAMLGINGCTGDTGGAINTAEKPEGGYLPTQDNYYGVAVVDQDDAWVVGQRGVVLHLTEGGRNVEAQETGLRNAWYSASFVDAQDGLISGEYGTIMRTRDGGKTWQRLSVDIPVPKEEVLVMGVDPTKDNVEMREAALPHIFSLARAETNPPYIWGVGERGTIVHSSNGGESWENLSLGHDVMLNGVYFVSETEGWIVGEFGTIIHTTDGGRTWEDQTEVLGLPKYLEPGVSDEEAYLASIPELHLEDLYFYDVGFNNPLEGYIVGLSGFLLQTSDGGKTWHYTHGDTYDHLFKIALANQQQGIVSGAVGTILTGGSEKKWKPLEDVQEHVYTWLRDVDFAPDGVFGVASGGNGTILITEDAGSKWGAVPRETLQMAGVRARTQPES